jgi:hypothetical protein
MSSEKWLLKWKRNRNHRGEEILPKKQAFELAETKKNLGFKVFLKKLPQEASTELSTIDVLM